VDLVLQIHIVVGVEQLIDVNLVKFCTNSSDLFYSESIFFFFLKELHWDQHNQLVPVHIGSKIQISDVLLVQIVQGIKQTEKQTNKQTNVKIYIHIFQTIVSKHAMNVIQSLLVVGVQMIIHANKEIQRNPMTEHVLELVGVI